MARSSFYSGAVDRVKMATKYIFVTGGVVSGIGKGVATASLGRLLRNRGYTVAPIKLDPYINVDAGTMNPFQHGEVFVTEDGAETDLDLGHYERFMDVNCSKGSSITTGKVYRNVIDAERQGKYLGGTVQVIPHVTNEIKSLVQRIAVEQEADVVIAEIGGTVGDIESLPFLEAIRQMRTDLGYENTMYVHVTMVPTVGPWHEVKTKPTQHSVYKLREIGIAPDVLICRCEVDMSEEVVEKISLFCGVPTEAVIQSQNVETIYEVPLIYENAGLGNFVSKRLGLEQRESKMQEWQKLVNTLKAPNNEVTIAVIGKYTSNGDAYKSIAESLIHAGIPNDCSVNIQWIESDQLEGDQPPASFLEGLDGIVIGPGFESLSRPDFHFSASALDYKWLSSSTHETYVGWKVPTAKKCKPTPTTPSFTSCPNKKESPKKAQPCDSVPTPVIWSTTRSQPSCTVPPESPSGIDTDTKSTTTSEKSYRSMAW